MSNNPLHSTRLGPDTPVIRGESKRAIRERTPVRQHDDQLSGRLSSAVSLSRLRLKDEFHYKELQDQEFRLIRLASSTSSGIECELFHAPLSQPPSYVAVSYVWGDLDDTVWIRLNGCAFRITSNLHAALKTLLKRPGNAVLWADAICINQRDRTEQSQQVKLMPKIYSSAQEVAIWLGTESDDSKRALDLLKTITTVAVASAGDHTVIDTVIKSKECQPHFTALVTLFERDYWSRLWVVQEVLNAKRVEVYCGESQLPWTVFQRACQIFQKHESALKAQFPGGLVPGSRQGFSYAHILSSQGPASLDFLRRVRNVGPESLLEVLHICRKKLTADPRDKVFAVLGILPEHIRRRFPLDYNASIKEVYTNVVAFLLNQTRRVDVICENIYFPIHISNIKLPSWVPDWSNSTQVAALGLTYGFSASRDTNANFRFVDDPKRTRLDLLCMRLDTINSRGVAVGTFCGLDDLLLAFLHWRARSLQMSVATDKHYKTQELRDEAFCRTLNFGQPSEWNTPSRWMQVCYHVFACLLGDRLPQIPLDDELQQHANLDLGIAPERRRGIIMDNCASAMMGRCFFTTHGGLVGMASGVIETGDVVCVPFGCSTPVVLRPEGGSRKHKFISDAYVDGFMYGKALELYQTDLEMATIYTLI
ncbi:heterokaryon incompatibility protein-domain-containing protein [Xylaria bambusicola]|uniref:heterokaryon incompatibility protein-domain-containing protein n=1 Tax=Xylaria bambusicola TaxID=326684 RepID=UPI0020086C8D|nr:heterokaryon incompatibility protein-domain-containing protein [Xylaria bambusicola]KAI0505832.1 heterokaryon incompatibility protein-domain-containing protein [Xylaria bambusicola]